VTGYDEAGGVHPVREVQNEDQTGTPTCLAMSLDNHHRAVPFQSNQIKSDLFAEIYHINIGSSKSVHEQGQQGWKQN